MADLQVKTKTLNFESLLFEFIEPIISLYKAGKTYYIASALPSEVGFVERYLIVSVRPKLFKRYFRNEIDLRYLFNSAPNRNFYILPADQVGQDKVKVKAFDEEIIEDWLPEPQFFSSNHNHTYREFESKNSALETLFIDGNWEMEDFGSFSRRYRDVYAFEQCLQKLSNASVSATEKSKITIAFRGHTLQGGGSYVNFFSELHQAIPANEQYDLKRVKYASPGEIELKGKGEVFDALEERIENYLQNLENLHTKYWNLRTFMSTAKLLDISRAPTAINPNTQKDLQIKTKDLLDIMQTGLDEVIFDLSQRNAVSSAKIAMALYRRIKSAATYFAEGRVVYER